MVHQTSFRKALLVTCAGVAIGGIAPAYAQSASKGPQVSDTAAAPEEIVVTGSRIVREGYESPTPLTVVGAEQLENSADSSIVAFLGTMPAISGNATTGNTTQQNGNGGVGVQSLNLRALGPNRVLVLLDGQRVVPSMYQNYVDVSNFPLQLMSRVDVVTGGVSAVYGSDAVSGVVNFVIDRKFVGVKGEISDGLTNYGDGKNYKVNLSGGFGFADDRGHVLVSGEHTFNAGIQGDGGRAWNQHGWLQLTNPTYTATNGQSQLLFLQNSAYATATAGGLVVAGPLKGTAFGAGGTPYKFNYGSVVSGSMMSGGDWQSTNIQGVGDMDPVQSNQRLFTRVSYDVTDNINVYAQYSFAHTRITEILFPVETSGTATAYVLQRDNAFIPASVRTAMTTSGATTLPIGSFNVDMGGIWNLTDRNTYRGSAGIEGNFDAFNTNWKWNAYYAYGSTKFAIHQNSLVKQNYLNAIDAVVNPATGQIVCRTTLTSPNNGCKPWNPLGINVNNGNQASIDYMTAGGGYSYGLIEQETMSASVTGEPFSVWAGPVSLAVNLEHRKDSDNGDADFYSKTAQRNVGNFPSLHGSQSVTEGALETVVPLVKDESWAKSWDLTAAARFTGYQYAGYVTTWKVGTTFTPIDDVKFRVTRSRDIRAPSILDLFATASTTTLGGVVRDPFNGNQTIPSGIGFSALSGNPNLLPEKGDTLGIGAVLQPRFLEGFTVSADYWDVKVSGAIQAISAQFILNSCYDNSIPALCSNIVRVGPTNTSQVDHINVNAINLAVQDVRGIDLEASYRMSMSDVVSDWKGNFSIHGVMTLYLRDFQDTGLGTPTLDIVGQNNGNGGGSSGSLPNWKMNVTASYDLDPVKVSLTGRAFSGGTFDNTYVVCTTGCPAATTAHPTTNANFAPGRFYLDANVSYKLNLGDTTQSDLFFSVRNMFNNDVPPMPSSIHYGNGHLGDLYDLNGAVYRAGIRFKM